METIYCSGNNLTCDIDFKIKSAATSASDISLLGLRKYPSLTPNSEKVGEGRLLVILFFACDVQVVIAFKCPCPTDCEYAPTRSANNRYGFCYFVVKPHVNCGCDIYVTLLGKNLGEISIFLERQTYLTMVRVKSVVIKQTTSRAEQTRVYSLYFTLKMDPNTQCA